MFPRKVKKKGSLLKIPPRYCDNRGNFQSDKISRKGYFLDLKNKHGLPCCSVSKPPGPGTGPARYSGYKYIPIFSQGHCVIHVCAYTNIYIHMSVLSSIATCIMIIVKLVHVSIYSFNKIPKTTKNQIKLWLSQNLAVTLICGN